MRIIIDLTGDEPLIVEEGDGPPVIDLTQDNPGAFIDTAIDVRGGGRRVLRGRARRVPPAAADQAIHLRVAPQATMVDEDEPYPADFWARERANRHGLFQRLGPDDVPGLERSSRPVQIQVELVDATFGSQQNLAFEWRHWCYAFVDNIEEKPLPDGSHVLVITLDCTDAHYFWAMLQANQHLFDVLHGQGLTQRLIQRRKALLAALLADRTKGWVLRVIIGNRNDRYPRLLDFFQPLAWRKIRIPPPPPRARFQLWDLIRDAAPDAFGVFFSPDLFVDGAERTSFDTHPITPVEVGFLEEIWSLNHIPDAPLPPAGGGIRLPNEPLNGFDFSPIETVYWEAGADPPYRTEIPAARIRGTDSAMAFRQTGPFTSEGFDLLYVKKGLYVLRSQRGGRAHSLLFLRDRVNVGRVLRFDDVMSFDVDAQVWALRDVFELVVIPAGSLFAGDRDAVVLRDRRTQDLFVPCASNIDASGVAFFVPEHANLMKK